MTSGLSPFPELCRQCNKMNKARMKNSCHDDSKLNISSNTIIPFNDKPLAGTSHQIKDPRTFYKDDERVKLMMTNMSHAENGQIMRDRNSNLYSMHSQNADLARASLRRTDTKSDVNISSVLTNKIDSSFNLSKMDCPMPSSKCVRDPVLDKSAVIGNSKATTEQANTSKGSDSVTLENCPLCQMDFDSEYVYRVVCSFNK